MITQLHTFPYLDELDMIQSLSSNISVQYDVYFWLLSVTISQVQATYYRGVTPQTDISMDQLNFTLSSLPIPSCQAGLHSWVVNVRLQCIYRAREGAGQFIHFRK